MHVSGKGRPTGPKRLFFYKIYKWPLTPPLPRFYKVMRTSLSVKTLLFFFLLFGIVLSAVGSTVFWGNETTASRFVLPGTAHSHTSFQIPLRRVCVGRTLEGTQICY